MIFLAPFFIYYVTVDRPMPVVPLLVLLASMAFVGIRAPIHYWTRDFGPEKWKQHKALFFAMGFYCGPLAWVLVRSVHGKRDR